MNKLWIQDDLIKKSSHSDNIIRKAGMGLVLCLWLVGTSLAMWFFNPIPKTTSIVCHAPGLDVQKISNTSLYMTKMSGVKNLDF